MPPSGVFALILILAVTLPLPSFAILNSRLQTLLFACPIQLFCYFPSRLSNTTCRILPTTPTPSRPRHGTRPSSYIITKDRTPKGAPIDDPARRTHSTVWQPTDHCLDPEAGAGASARARTRTITITVTVCWLVPGVPGTTTPAVCLSA